MAAGGSPAGWRSFGENAGLWPINCRRGWCPMSCGIWWHRACRNCGPARRAGDGAAAGPGAVHRDRVRAGQRLRLAGPPAVFRRPVPDRAPPVRAVDEGGGAWPRIHRAVLDELGSQGLIDWSRAIMDAACVRAKKGAA